MIRWWINMCQFEFGVSNWGHLTANSRLLFVARPPLPRPLFGFQLQLIFQVKRQRGGQIHDAWEDYWYVTDWWRVAECYPRRCQHSCSGIPSCPSPSPNPPPLFVCLPVLSCKPRCKVDLDVFITSRLCCMLWTFVHPQETMMGKNITNTPWQTHGV